MFRFNKEEEKRVIEMIINLAQKGKIKESRINRSVKRIIEMKEKYEISDEKEIIGIDVDEINKQIKKIREKCDM